METPIGDDDDSHLGDFIEDQSTMAPSDSAVYASLRGVTKDVVLKTESLGRAKDPWGGEHALFSAHTSINRTEYGLNWNQALEAGGVLVGEKVDINLEVQLLAK